MRHAYTNFAKKTCRQVASFRRNPPFSSSLNTKIRTLLDFSCSCYVLVLAWPPSYSIADHSRQPAKDPARWLPVGVIGIGECAGASQPSCGAFTLFPVYRASQRRREEGLKDVGGLNAEIRTGHPAAAPRPTPYLPGIPGAKVVFQRRCPRMSEPGHAAFPYVPERRPAAGVRSGTAKPLERHHISRNFLIFKVPGRSY